ncbi:MAG TPA: beta-ketoacyl synthase chain length factor [Agriterribacter sp.]|nr:beta-ketoacyl synthase chain length factor [Agriterribacter sp.]
MYIHQYSCISPQESFEQVNLDTLHESVDNKLKVREPVYNGIPPGILRRMGKAVRVGIGAALPVLKTHPIIDGIIIGTANGGMEDCIQFLNQIIDYEEGMLTPGNFVQSTPNAIAAQLGLLRKNKGYNITHVHRGLAFENALIDAMMMLKEMPGSNFLLGGIDEISAYNYNIESLAGSFKTEPLSNTALYNSLSAGTLAGEGAAMFLVSDSAKNAVGKVNAIQTLHTNDEREVKAALQQFIKENIADGENADLFISGENGDGRLIKYYDAAESLFSEQTTIARFKHMCGEYPTASAFALWLACGKRPLPLHMTKRKSRFSEVHNIIIYNNYKGHQHSFMLLVK